MSLEERKGVLERWIKASDGRLKIIAHVGAESVADMMALAKHAQLAGANAIAAMPTTFNKPASLDIVVEMLSILAASAPELPLYYYHIAIKTGVHIRCDKLLEKIHAEPSRVPTFREFRRVHASPYLSSCMYARPCKKLSNGGTSHLTVSLGCGCRRHQVHGLRLAHICKLRRFPRRHVRYTLWSR